MRNRDTNKRARANVKQTKHHSHSLIRVKLSRETHWIMCNRKLTLRLLGSRQQGSERCVAVLAVKLSTVMLQMGADKDDVAAAEDECSAWRWQINSRALC